MRVYPACAGIDLPLLLDTLPCLCLPRMRGDRPALPVTLPGPYKFTPHARGSTVIHDVVEVSFAVYPACAGIDRGRASPQAPTASLPRMRGDRPCNRVCRSPARKFTPHARGSTPEEDTVELSLTVYPACAGIDRRGKLHRPTNNRLPRMRGDRPFAIFSNCSAV